MAIKCGIVGLPNVGKSTLFNALTAAEIPAENYPFCTIEPNVGIVPVPDPRLDVIAGIVNPAKLIPTTMEFVDIAGLVAGASKGEGLGNQFLANIRETHAIAHVVRCFEDDDVTHVAGKISPIDDIETINTELALADLEAVEKQLVKAEKNAKTAKKEDIYLRDTLKKLKAPLDEGLPIRAIELDENETAVMRRLQLLTSKPVMYVANVAEDGFENNPYLDAVRDYAAQEGATVVAICASIEAEIAVLDEADKAEFLADLGMDEPGLDKVIRAGYDLIRAHLGEFLRTIMRLRDEPDPALVRAELKKLRKAAKKDEALASGLVMEIHDDPLGRASELATQMAGYAPLTLRVTKEGLRRLRTEGSGANDRDLIETAYMSEDFKEGMEAFLGKRKPEFKGR